MESLDVLTRTLDQAASQDPHILKFAEDKLKGWETQSEFYKALLTICFDETLATHVRWMAILFFKNGMDKYWRRMVNRIFTEEDKNIIKQLLITSFAESVNQIALQKAVVIGRIARTDLKIWPDLIPKLIQEVRSQDKTIQYNSLLTLNHIIKGLISKRLASDRRMFKEVSSGLLEFVFDLWIHHSNEFVTNLSANQAQSAEESLKMSVLTLKVLRKLVVEGTSEMVESSSVMLLQTLIEKIPDLLSLRSQFLHAPNVGERVEKLISISMKTLLGTQDRHPLLFVNVLENALNMAINYAFVCSEKDIIFEMFIVQCANLIRRIIKSKDYKIPNDSQAAKGKDASSLRAQQIKESIMTQNLVAELCRQLILKYFPLSAQELAEWESDPESYLSEDAGESFEFVIRPCSENLFLCLYYEYRPIFTDVLSNMVNSLNVSYNKDDIGCLLTREAVYFALGLASYELFGDLNFDKYFQETLLSELQNSSPGMKMIHRRVLWLIGRWINVSFSKSNRNILYQLLIKMLDRKEDLVVRITASQTLKDAVDDCDFQSSDISTYVKDLWERLFCLLIDVQQGDTKMGILNVISILIERAGAEMKPYAAHLCQYLPHLWEDSADHNMLRCVVVSTLTHIVEALGSESSKLHTLLLSIIQVCTDQNQPCHVYLIDDGLELWLAVIQNSFQMTEDSLRMFGLLPVLLEQTSENFTICINIMESYLLLDALNVLKMHSSLLCSIVYTLIGQMKDEGNILLSELVRILLITVPRESPILFDEVLKKILKILLEDQEYPRVLTAYLSLFGYILLHDTAVFFNIINNFCLDTAEQPEKVAAQLIDVWLEKLDFMADDRPRKLTAMALVSLLPSNAEFVNKRFALILDTVVNVLHGTTEEKLSEQGLDASRHSLEACNETNKELNLGEQRKNQLQLRDFAQSVPLLDFVKCKIAEARNALGQEKFQSLTETMDPVVAKQLFSLIV